MPADGAAPPPPFRPALTPCASSQVLAALDLGTNNCRLLMGVPTTGTGFRIVDSFSRTVRLGEGLGTTGRLGEAAMARALRVLHACGQKLHRRPARALQAVATEACRCAANGPAFLDRVPRETGLRLRVISPRRYRGSRR